MATDYSSVIGANCHANQVTTASANTPTTQTWDEALKTRPRKPGWPDELGKHLPDGRRLGLDVSMWEAFEGELVPFGWQTTSPWYNPNITVYNPNTTKTNFGYGYTTATTTDTLVRYRYSNAPKTTFSGLSSWGER